MDNSRTEPILEHSNRSDRIRAYARQETVIMFLHQTRLYILSYSNTVIGNPFTEWLDQLQWNYVIVTPKQLFAELEHRIDAANNRDIAIVIVDLEDDVNLDEKWSKLHPYLLSASSRGALWIGSFVVVKRDSKRPIFALLDHGLDDIILFPCTLEEWEARVKRAFHMKKERFAAIASVLQVDDLTLNRSTREVCRGEELIDLTPREYELLHVLIANVNIPLSRAYLMEKVWSIDFETNTNILDVYIRYLRRKIDRGRTHKLIRTVRGYGYKLVSPTAPLKSSK